MGEHDTSTHLEAKHQDIPIAHYEAHENFTQKIKTNDIAIVYLVRDASFDGELQTMQTFFFLNLNSFHSHVQSNTFKFSASVDHIRPVCLPFSSDLLNHRFVDSTPFLAGWSINVKPGVKEMTPILMQSQAPVISNKLCKRLYSKVSGYETDPLIDDRILCTGSKKGSKEICLGDSGGPIMLPIHQNRTFPFYQIGIISDSEGCVRRYVPGVNTNIQFYADWILTKLTLKIEGVA